jgi:hypothetical protein
MVRRVMQAVLSRVAMQAGLTTAARLPAATAGLSALVTAAQHRVLLPTVAHPAWAHALRASPAPLLATTVVVTASPIGAMQTASRTVAMPIAATASALRCVVSSHRVDPLARRRVP